MKISIRKPYVHKYINDVNARSLKIKLLKFSDYLSYFNFLSKYPTYVPRFFDYMEILDGKFRALEDYAMYHSAFKRTRTTTMIMRSHPSLSMLGNMAKKSVPIDKLYEDLLEKQFFYMGIQCIQELHQRFEFKSHNAL